MLHKKSSRALTLISFLMTGLAVVAAVWAVSNQQYIRDQITVWQYEPTAQVAAIAERADMSEQGKFYFYASQPAIDTAAQFNQQCTRQEENNAILGCYSAQRIYVYDIPSTELDGIEEVSAAHEMLHAAWERMGKEDQKKVGDLLEAVFSKINDPKLNDRMAYYARTEPGERTNELHSILGTEYRDLGTALEAHYKQYFSDRTKIISLYETYQSVFAALKAQSDALAAEMLILKTSIDAKSAQYNAEAAAVNLGAAALQNSASSVDRTSASQVNAYNAKRQALLNRIDALDVLRIEINNETASYNMKVSQYNALVVSTNNLNNSLDSTLAPTPSI